MCKRKGNMRIDAALWDTCFTIVTAVLPLQKQSKFGWDLNTLSIALYAFMKASLHIEFSSSSADKPFSDSPLSGFMLLLKQALPEPFRPDSEECKNESSFSGKASLTLRATRWPCGPWPSKTPQKVTSSDMKSYKNKDPNQESQLPKLTKSPFIQLEQCILNTTRWKYLLPTQSWRPD